MMGSEIIMRIAFITFEYPPFVNGGAGIYAMNVTREMAKLGNEVTVFTPQIESDKSLYESDNLNICRVPLNDNVPFKALQFWLKLPEVIMEAESINKFDIIHFNGLSYWFLKNKLSKVPHIITIHHLVTDAIKCNNLSLISRFCDIRGENSFFIPFIEKKCVKCADKIISVSEFTKKQIVDNYKISPGKIEVVYNGMELKEQTFTEKELDELKKQYGIPQKPVILFVGRVDDHRKGLDFLLRSFKNVLEMIDSILLVVGKGDQTNAKKIAMSLGIHNHVFFTGFVNESTLKKCYSLCDVYAVPSRLEGFGLTILEAMAAGKPVVATNVGAIPEIIKIGENGTLVQFDDIFDFANVMHIHLDNKSSDESLSGKNKSYMQRKYNWKMNALATQRIYMSMINRNELNSSCGFNE